MGRYHAIARVAASLATRQEVAFFLDAEGVDEEEIDELLGTEWPGLLERFEGMPDPMEVWRAVAVTEDAGLKEDSLGVHWSWTKAGAYPYAYTEQKTFDTLTLHGEVEKRHVDWPRTFVANLSSYEDETEILIYRGAPIRLLDINGKKDGRTLRS